MPVFYIPSGFLFTGVTVPAGSPTTGIFNDETTGTPVVAPTADGPTIMQTWILGGITTPILVSATGTTANPTQCNLTLTLSIGGTIAWMVQTVVALSAGPLLSGNGQTFIAADFVNPLELRTGNKLTFGASGVFDVDTLRFQATIARLGSIPLGSFQVIPAPIRYTIDYDQRLKSNA